MIIRVSVPPEVYARELKRLDNFLNGRHSHARPCNQLEGARRQTVMMPTQWKRVQQLASRVRLAARCTLPRPAPATFRASSESVTFINQRGVRAPACRPNDISPLCNVRTLKVLALILLHVFCILKRPP